MHLYGCEPYFTQPSCGQATEWPGDKDVPAEVQQGAQLLRHGIAKPWCCPEKVHRESIGFVQIWWFPQFIAILLKNMIWQIGFWWSTIGVRRNINMLGHSQMQARCPVAIHSNSTVLLSRSLERLPSGELWELGQAFQGGHRMPQILATRCDPATLSMPRGLRHIRCVLKVPAATSCRHLSC